MLGAPRSRCTARSYFYLHESAGFFSGPSQARELPARLGLAAVSLFTLSALFTKLGVAPPFFRYWVADVYEGSPAIVTVFLSVVVRVAVFFVLAKVLAPPLAPCAAAARPVLVVVSALSITAGCLGALFQKRIKRLLAYSSINNAGYGLAGLAVGNAEGLQAGLSYIVFYSASLLLLFVVILGCGSGGRPPIVYVVDLKNLRSNKSMAMPVVFSATLFSFAGMPPLTGFWVKFFVLSALVTEKLYLLAFVGALASVVGSFYYVSLIKVLLFEERCPGDGASQGPNGAAAALASALSLVVFAYALAPGPVNSYFFALAGSVLCPLAR